MEETGLFAESIADIPCTDTEFFNTHCGRVAIFRLEGICAGKLCMGIGIDTNFAGQKVVGFEYQVFDDEVDVGVLIFDPWNGDISN